MGERELLILLLAGLCVPASNQIRKVYVETVKSWSEAQSYCREKHTDLATVRSQEEAEQLLNITGDSLNDTAWIGLYRDDTQNWQWSNSDDVIYTNWKAELFCASVKSSEEWEDRVCNEGKAFMCYNDGSSGQCFYGNTEKTWQEAQSYCRSQGRDLPTIQDQARVSEIISLINSTSKTTFWIGLYRDKQNWQWSNGDDVIYYHWRPPNLFCASVNSKTEWEGRVCNEINNFMCYSETSNITERYTLIEELKTWTEAQQYCIEHHTDLVSIKSDSENEDLVKKAQGKPFWIGLFNNPWKWSHQGDNYTFHNWNTGEPNNVGGNENCVEIGVRDDPSRGEWHDKDCSLKLPFFCFDGNRDDLDWMARQ
ncbi:macrophage mannose receptor 1-like [Acipenser ruthenus]|uniref:macrophage mannose receptor 1-like n=1 Tax=Acipenser ruthenus TaxID=7906 RepID=UPI0027415539|nr:macrophage mannose receptor 1-like [Acipenser ruthenus]